MAVQEQKEKEAEEANNPMKVKIMLPSLCALQKVMFAIAGIIIIMVLTIVINLRCSQSVEK